MSRPRSAFVAFPLLLCLLIASCRTRERAPDQVRLKPATAPARAEFRLPDDFFAIMPWELPPRSLHFDDPDHGLKSLADCGFTTAAFVPARLVPECRRLGLRAIVFGGDEVRRWKTLSDEQIRASVKKMIDEAGRDETILGYFICDEPGVQEFASLAKAVAAVKELAPGKLAYINLYPNYATLGAPNLSQLGTDNYAEYLERFITEVKPQLLSYDNYRVLFSKDLSETEVAKSYFTNLMQVRETAQRHNLPFWNIITSNQIRPYTPVPSPANLLMQAYTTLAAGGQGLTYFTYYAGKYRTAPVDRGGQRTVIWSYLKMVNDQLKVIGPLMRRLKSTGVYFTAPPPDESLSAMPGELIESVNSAMPLMVGEFTHASDGTQYVMLVNLSLERSTEAIVTMRSPSTPMYQVSPADGSHIPLPPGETLWLTAGQGLLLRLDDPSAAVPAPAPPSR
ncbi:MAG TPA: hypothetical protein VGR35_18360 [Tepidisphaeraceae bacterium]|nr:hypothetical protein [Tepidisphaeraceae bacterium]